VRHGALERLIQYFKGIKIQSRISGVRALRCAMAHKAGMITKYETKYDLTFSALNFVIVPISNFDSIAQKE
jgi:hypothetical protein